MKPKAPTRNSETTSPLLECRDLRVSIGGQCVVDALNLAAGPGQSIGILGPNGAGKTTLLLALAGVRPHDNGSISLNGQEMASLSRREIARELGMLTQNTRFAFDASALEVALSGRHPHIGALGRESAADLEAARQALRDVELESLAERSCRELSGGEQRRLALAVVLAQNPSVMLLDEPTNHLDPAHQVAILDRLWLRVHHQRRCQVIALHDVNLATCYCTDVLMLFGDGRWDFGPTPEMLTAARLSRLFGCEIRAVSDHRQTVFAVAGGVQDVEPGVR
ncbi:MAG: ABC transporter ATP-binding protein [Wenzhouxiangellaceae bacterium]|nr:ABC transporter ATP-binding protein [Wenzhouxiangellaceae bacterium]